MYGPDGNPVSKELFLEVLSGPMSHPMVEAALFALMKALITSDDTIVTNSFFSMKIFTDSPMCTTDVNDVFSHTRVILPTLLRHHWFVAFVSRDDEMVFETIGADKETSDIAYEQFLAFLRLINTTTEPKIPNDSWVHKTSVLQQQVDSYSCGVYMLYDIVNLVKSQTGNIANQSVNDMRKGIGSACLMSRSLRARPCHPTTSINEIQERIILKY